LTPFFVYEVAGVINPDQPQRKGETHAR